MIWTKRLFLLVLKLYPRGFREQFAEEMEAVFCAGLDDARQRSMAPGFVLREVLGLPASLADAYIWSIRAEESSQAAVSGAGGTVSGRPPTQGNGWGAALLAGLPHLLLGILVVSTALLAGVTWIDQAVLGIFLLVVFSLLLLGGLLYNLYSGWQRWSASWLIYIFVIALALLKQLADLLSPVTFRSNWLDSFQAGVYPLVLAYLLYKMAGADRLRGLLAAVPLTAVIWIFFEEFVPALPRLLAWGWLCLVAFGATVMMLRAKRFSPAVWLALAVPVLCGLPFVYLGVYMGGTLPFSEPGPSLDEVFRQYLPFLVMVFTIPLGPQLAAMLRLLGRESAAAGGKIFYRLALGGLLLGLAVALMQWVSVNSGSNYSFKHFLGMIREGGIIVAGLLYLAGFVGLVWAALRSEPLASDSGLGLRMAVLFMLLPGVPALLYLTIPGILISRQLEGWPLLLGYAWALAATVWVARSDPPWGE